MGQSEVRSSAESSKELPKYEVGLSKLKWLGAGGFVLFGVFLGVSVASERMIPAFVFLAYSALSLFVLSLAGSFCVSHTALTLENWWGSYKIEWDQIERVEKGQSLMVFFGKDSHFSVPLPIWWNGDAVRSALELLEHEMQSRCLPVTETFRADYLFQKRTKGSETRHP